jgi:hypothetical protein
MVGAICRSVDELLPLGRKLIRLTVDHPPAPGTPRRGYRRIGWIEQAIGPLRAELSPARFEDLVSELAMVIGWEAFVVRYDIRGLDAEQAERVSLTAALRLVAPPSQPPESPRRPARDP